jgi:hypothetical protein
MAKNAMHRALDDLIDRPPGEADQKRLREFFGDRCCYCGADAPRRDGHIDHADPAGGNDLGNLLLSCSLCNGDEKRQMKWDDFLRAKCGGDSRAFEERSARIRAWFGANRRERRALSAEVQIAKVAAERAIAEYETAYVRLRDALAAQAKS